MEIRNHARWWRALFAAAATWALVVPVAGSAGGAPPSGGDPIVPGKRSAAGVYIVRMAQSPVVAYEGGRQGLPATAPRRGQHINPNSAAVRKYSQFLDGRHSAVLAAAGASGAKFYDYRYSFNGFAATLTQVQAARLAAQPGVISVSPGRVLIAGSARHGCCMRCGMCRTISGTGRSGRGSRRHRWAV